MTINNKKKLRMYDMNGHELLNLILRYRQYFWDFWFGGPNVISSLHCFLNRTAKNVKSF